MDGVSSSLPMLLVVAVVVPSVIAVVRRASGRTAFKRQPHSMPVAYVIVAVVLIAVELVLLNS